MLCFEVGPQPDFGDDQEDIMHGRANRIASTTRRNVLRGMGAAGAASVVGPGWIRPASATATLNYICWEGYDAPELIRPFEEAHDVKVQFDLIVDSAGAFAKIAAGGHREFDVASLDSPWISRMGPSGMCELLDPAEFETQYNSFYEEFRHPFEPLLYDGKPTGLPTRWGWVAAPINLEHTTEEAWRSYDPCFDPGNRDRIGVMDWGDWPILPMALYAGVDPYKELDQNELEEVRKVLRALFKNTRALFSDLTTARNALLDGSVLTLVGTGTYTTNAMRKEGHSNILTVVPEPKDGLNQGIVWLEASAIIKEPNEPELAKALIKHMVEPENAMKLSWTESTVNLTPVQAVEDMYSPEQKSVLQMSDMWEAWEKSVFHDIAPNIDDMLQIWQEELARAG
jgi:spermidine/putrescine transport system substrate-binding protein